jgi:hypothetical protein
MKFGWIGDKTQKRSKMDIKTERAPEAITRSKIKVLFEFDMEYPTGTDVVSVLRNTQTEMKVQAGVEIHEGDILHVEVLKSDYVK